MFDCRKFLNDYAIPYINTGSNVSSRYIGVNCPFCSDSGYHGGFNIETGSFTCWKCGKHKILDTIQAYCLLSKKAGYIVLQKYVSGAIQAPTSHFKDKKVGKQGSRSKCPLPYQSGTLQNKHKKYLINRGFNADDLIQTWELQATRNIGTYKFRIIAPIFLNRKLVSYQGRDITGMSELKYRACAKENEVVHHKHTLYGIDQVPNDVAIIVEGITDVWKLGVGAIATFGIEYTQEQVLMINKKFRKVFVLYDAYPQAAVTQGMKLATEIQGLGTEVEILELEKGDPGELSTEKAKEIMDLIYE